jgi:hypothetical protein
MLSTREHRLQILRYASELDFGTFLHTAFSSSLSAARIVAVDRSWQQVTHFVISCESCRVIDLEYCLDSQVPVPSTKYYSLVSSTVAVGNHPISPSRQMTTIQCFIFGKHIHRKSETSTSK